MQVEYIITNTGRIIRRTRPTTPAEIVTIREAEKHGARRALHSFGDNERKRKTKDNEQ